MDEPSKRAKKYQDMTLQQKNEDLFGKPFGSGAQRTQISLVEDISSQVRTRSYSV